jgi:hypothetical protein
MYDLLCAKRIDGIDEEANVIAYHASGPSFDLSCWLWLSKILSPAFIYHLSEETYVCRLWPLVPASIQGSISYRM